MKTHRSIIILAVGFLVGTAAWAADGHKHDHTAKPDASPGKLVEPTEADTTWLAQARTAYPLKSCVVSDDEIGGHGDAIERIYRVKGQPDRLVRFCCDSCIDDFSGEPAKFLRKLDEAAKARPTEPKHHH